MPRTTVAARTTARPRSTALTRRHSTFDGPPLALAPWLDRVSEGWWRLRPRSRAAITLALALVVALTAVARVLTDPYGAPTTVLVTTRDLPAGHDLSASDLRRRTWPEGLVPPRATVRREGRLAVPLTAGSVLVESHLDASGPARGLGADRVAVAIPQELVPALVLGDRLDVLAAGPDGSGVVVASDATTLWLATMREEAPAVVAAVLRGTVGVALLPR
ncbi:MAG: hypothetical protein RLZZ272_766 [Actinomycetota bacterium]